jgi:hypothetical protein
MSDNLPMDLEELKKYIKENLSPDEYKIYQEGFAKCKEEQPCLIQAFFAHEAEKPAHLRKTSCMISCPCPRCRPGTM